MIIYRLCKSIYKNDLHGKGAEIAGGRWNSRGSALLYTSQSRALCVTEVAVHLPLGIVPDDYCLLTIEVPDTAKVKEIEAEDLPAAWKALPYIGTVQGIGDRFIAENKCLALRVPSAVVDGDFNFLINPLHKDFSKLKVLSAVPFVFDNRLLRALA